jgi:hypothetical protein
MKRIGVNEYENKGFWDLLFKTLFWGDMTATYQTCIDCSHFNTQHNLCPMFTIRYPFGKVYLKRLPESPICTTEYIPRQKIEEEFLSSNLELF